jgi:hypothetical protein
MQIWSLVSCCILYCVNVISSSVWTTQQRSNLTVLLFYSKAVDSGRILLAISLFIVPGNNIARPDRLLLKEPKYGKTLPFLWYILHCQSETCSYVFFLLLSVKMMGSSEPFTTHTYRSTSESQTMCFIKQASTNSHSTATKSHSTVSSSTTLHANNWLISGTGKMNSAKGKSKQRNTANASDSESDYEHNQKVTEAVVTEFTFMPMKSVRLVEGGLVLSDYAYYRLRKLNHL